MSIALCATGFLSGPKAQCKKMWLPTRRYSTAFYLIMIIVVFIVAVMKQNVFLVLFLLAVEIVAGAWYSISYIPFARKIVLNFLRACGICFPCFYVSDQCHEVYEKNFKSSSPSTMTSVMGGGSKSSSSGGMFGGNSNSGSQSSSGFFGGGNTTTTSSSGGFFGGK